MSEVSSVKPFFEPSSVAVIGASRTPGKGGNTLIRNLLKSGLGHRIYPINHNATEILGLKAYPGINDIPEVADLVIVSVPPESAMEAVRASIEKGVKSAIIETAGFAEVDATGRQVEKEIADLARRGGMRVMGPNSIGTINMATNFFSGFPPVDTLAPGNVAFVAQSGLFSSVFLPFMQAEVGPSKIACMGNKCDLDESDFLEYLADDDATKVICMYLESIKDGRRFLSIARQVIRKKPIIIMKSGRTDMGARASSSHTGSLAGQQSVIDGAFRQLGIIAVNSFDELFDMAKIFSTQPEPKGKQLGIVSQTGAGCVISADACADNGIEVADVSPDALRRSQQVFPSWWKVKNPADIWPACEYRGIDVAYEEVGIAFLSDKNVDAVLVITGAFTAIAPDVKNVIENMIARQFNKPIVMSCMLGTQSTYDEIRQSLKGLGVPVYPDVARAVRAFAALHEYYHFREHISAEIE